MSSRFLKPVRCIRLGREAIQVRQFDTAHYNEAVPEHYHIRIPDSMKRAVIQRQAEFVAGRVAACDALRACRSAVMQLPVGQHRAPIWPDGVVGSISHHDHLAVAIARRSRSDMLGVDIENWIKDATLETIQGALAGREDREQMQGLSLSQYQRMTVLFSAKESVFKALYPRTGCYFDFSESMLSSWHEGKQSLTLDLTPDAAHKAGRALRFHIHYRLEPFGVLTLAQGRWP